MGRYDFRPARVYDATTQLLATGRINRRPPWYDVVGNITPSQILVRTKPINHGKTRRPSRKFQPQEISYEEDRLRREFFSDHPWELARPTVVLENDGMDSRNMDWSNISPRGRQLSGESVVQRQIWLMENSRMAKEAAYDQARREFYAQRLRQEVGRRVAKEEALATGAYFGKSMLKIGAELEDEAYEQWSEWASKTLEELQQAKTAVVAGMEAAPPADAEVKEEGEGEVEEVVLETPSSANT